MQQLNNESVVELTVEEMTVANGGNTKDPISDLIKLLMGGPVMPV